MIKKLLTLSLGLVGCLMATNASAAEMRRPLSPDQPLYFFHIDTWNGADPQKIINLIPEDMLPYTVFNISMSVTESVTKDGFRTSESWLRTCAENHVWAMIQPASGGHSWFSDYDFSVYRYFFENYPNFIGLNYCEQFWGFDTADGLHPFGDKSPTVADRMNLFANLLDICDEFGGYLCISNCLVIPQWDSTSPLTMYKCYPEFAAKAKEHQEHLIYCEKYTMSANYYDMESMCLGVWLAGGCGHYGMRFDQCGYNEHPKNIPASEKTSDIMPESIGGMTMMEHMMMTGQTVTDGPELIWQQCVRNLADYMTDDGYYSRQWEFFPQFPNVYLDIWRKFTTDKVLRIMTREEVIDSTKVAMWNDIQSKTGWEGRRAHQYLFTNLYALDYGTFGTDSTYLKKTGRYPTIPTLPWNVEEGFENVVKQSQYYQTWSTLRDKQAYFNSLFAPQAEDDPEGGLYVRRVDNNWLMYNTTQFENKAMLQTSTFKMLFNSVESVKATLPFCSFGLVTEKADGLDIYLNNYRSWTNVNTTDVIVINGCTSAPTVTYKERGSHKASTVEHSYADGVLTLSVTHNGPLDITVKCTGAGTDRLPVPAFEGTRGYIDAPQYNGPRQYEWENADYINVDRNNSTLTRSDVPGFTALGYASFGSNRSAKLRDIVRVDEAGTYVASIRYLAPDGDINKINFKVNGAIAARNLSFPQTGAEEWKTIEFDMDLNAGQSEVLLYTTAAQSNTFYLDNLILTPKSSGIGDAMIDIPEDEDAPCYNLQGIQVDPAKLAPGQIYIRQGKKLVK